MSSQIFKDPEILNLLEWHLVTKELENLAHFHHTVKERIFTLKNETDVVKCFDKTERLISSFDDESFIEASHDLEHLSEEGELFTCVKRLSKGAILDFKQLNHIALGIEFYLGHYFTLAELDYTTETKQDFHDVKRKYLNGFLKEFRSFVSTDGEIDFFKHPLLRVLFKEKIELEQKIRKTLQLTMGDTDWSPRLQFTSFDLINDRYVLPIKSDSYQSNLGQIVSRSDSGQTLFIEPAKIKNLNTQRLELVLKLDKELNSLTLKFSNQLSSLCNHLNHISNVILFFAREFWFTEVVIICKASS